MKILFIVGKSGSGKTGLAKNLEEFKAKSFKRIVQYTSREMRDNEIDGDDYHFITKNEMKVRSEHDEFFAEVKNQFSSLYGTPFADLDPKRVNVVVASIEAIFDSLAKFKSYSGITILNIKNVDPEAKRDDGRDANSEELYNTIILDKMKDIPAFKKINFVDIEHDYLKLIRNDSKKLLKFMKDEGVSAPLFVIGK